MCTTWSAPRADGCGATVVHSPPCRRTSWSANCSRHWTSATACPTKGAHVDEIILGVSTLTQEQGGDISRAASIWAGWPDDVSGAVVGRLCCSGLDAIAAAAAQVTSGMADLVVGGGVESMSRVPMLADKPSIAFDEEVG